MHTLLVTWLVDHAAHCHEVSMTNILDSSISLQDVTHWWFLYAHSASWCLTKTCPAIVGIVLQFSWLTPSLLVISKVCKSCPFRAPRMKTNLNSCSPWDLEFTHAAVRTSQESLEYKCQTPKWNCFKHNPGSSKCKDEHNFQMQSKRKKLKWCCCPGPHSSLIIALV